MGTDTSRPSRAYVAAPTPPEEGLLIALKWCFQTDPTIGWEGIGFLVPHPGFFYERSLLGRLRARGAPMATVAALEALEGFTGPLIAYRPDPHMLATAEDLPDLLGVVAVADRNDWLRHWAQSHRADHLGGDVL